MKEVLKWIIVFGFLSIVSWLLNITVEARSEKKFIKTKYSTLSTIPLLNTDSLHLEWIATKGRQAVIIYFDSDCDHCQSQAKKIITNLGKFSNADLLFFSSEPINKIKSFQDKYELATSSNISVGQISKEYSTNVFGELSFPHILIYDHNKHLVKEYRGETKLDAITRYLE